MKEETKDGCIKAGKGGQECGGGRGKLRVISIWRVRKEERNSEETEREAAKTGHCMKQNRAEAEEQGVLQGMVSCRATVSNRYCSI